VSGLRGGGVVTRILAIDPGTTQSAWLVLDNGRPAIWTTEPNEDVIARARTQFPVTPDVVVIEEIQSYGMAVGREVFETVRWAGRFEEACHPTPVQLLPRRAVKDAICHSPKASDANIRAALIDRFGGKAAAVGSKDHPGTLYGIHADVWSALAIAVTWYDRKGDPE
jgi:hypothetical protein